MFQKEELLELFRLHGNKLYLGEILQTRIGYEWRARATELRKLGYVIALERGARPSENIYRLYEPDAAGQLSMI